ncbi:DUF4397 domain-containing protein [Arcticibacter tournemirensis]
MKKILYLITFAVFLAGCEKSEFVETTPYTTMPVGDTQYSYLKFLNATTGSPSVNFYVDSTKVSGVLSSTGIENGYSYGGLFPDLGYSVVSPGAQILTAKIVTSATAGAGLKVLSTQLNKEAGKYYSIFTTGTYDATTKVIPSALIVEDIRPAIDTSKAFLRIVNLYQGGPSIDLVQKTTGEKIISGVAYGTVSDFVSIPYPGAANVYNFYNSATNTLAVATTATSTLTKGRAYTLVLRGVSGSTAYPFALTSYTTFYF